MRKGAAASRLDGMLGKLMTALVTATIVLVLVDQLPLSAQHHVVHTAAQGASGVVHQALRALGVSGS